ncbi:hypothetical protein [Pelosinus sp. UFO1]|uniref:hypothetical protein n=1 Tax=Pelosinus sp. UFO1 TaxID=484770 RepID=UPI0004D1F59E|nr:hypothetical protein [Pelosinus sp. UFO1]AIF52782.1 hypothetical protein UFO1_3239 [Pelosinus sp. UFO1]
MSGYTNVLDRGVADKNEEEISEETLNNEKNETKLVDITQQQWFWDQGVMS